MGNIADKLAYLKGTKDLFKDTLEEKRGLDLTDVPFRQYPVIMGEELDKGGGAEGEGHLVRFIDYNGDIIKQERVKNGENATAPTAEQMPNHLVETDKHPSLTFDGWNNALTNVTENRDIGAVYKTTDGKTHFYLQITGGTGKNIDIYLSNNEGGNIVINWGDGTADFSSTSTSITASHTFAEYGVYHCTIENTLFGDFQIGRGANSIVFCGGISQQMREALMAIYVGEKAQTSNYIFYYNYALKYITLPDSVTSIESYAFNNCYSLTNITIPNSVNSIGTYAFSRCSSFTSISIPDSVTSIGNSAFRYCYSLTNITIPDSVTSIGASAFSSCYSLTSISIPNSVTSIADSAFYYCHSLTSVTLPNSVTSIGTDAFRQCYSLTSVTLPNSVTSIADSAFRLCYSLKKVLIEGDTVKTLSSSDAFGDTPKSTLFFVKDELVEDYKTATNWTTYKDQIVPMSEEANYYG